MINVIKTTQDLDEIRKEDLMPGNIPQSSLPTPEFIETVQRIDSAKKTAEAATSHPATPQMPPVEVSQPKDDPIVLEYKYTGTCPTCHTKVSTLMMDVLGKSVATAYCKTCDKSLEQRIVKPLKGGDHGNTGITVRPAVRKEVRKVSQAGKTSL